MRNQIASIGINQSEETYLLAPKSLYKGEPLLLEFQKILIFFLEILKKYYFPGSFFTENFAKWLWLKAILKPLDEGLWKIAKAWTKMSFKGLEKQSRNIFYNLLL